jgi:glycerophosphoryl diester phosphodiesterase
MSFVIQNNISERSKMNPWICPEKPLVIAHRGYSLVAPENTILSYRKAIEAGADMLEVDINLTRDGQLVMIHDHRLERTTNGTGFVYDYLLSELIELDAGFHFKPRLDAIRIPTTEETIQLAMDAGIKVCFEIKGGETTRAKIIAEKLI